ncbi:WxL domain-containing protein [Vagococcus salmoninarum]|uniref:WxL domain-containing protein n=1 Tax=Vagococcus salmoninarum TaxID=2739 RepID=UPI00188002DB|nr:WxL domain-containing protein [Vagococcus salmoninarum]MBE9388216.1 WxL domain-containing protein [Vagococcus salmoninarum]
MGKTKISGLGLLCVSTLAVISQPVLAVEIGQESQLKSTGNVQFKQDLVTDPEENNGPLRIESVTMIDFGIVGIKGDTATYNAIYSEDVKEEFLDESGTVLETNFLPLTVQTADDRGTNQGWQLQVTHSRQFTELGPDGQLSKADPAVLKGAEINLSVTSAQRPSDKQGETTETQPTGLKQKVNLNDQVQTVVNAQANEGMGTWQSLFGEKVSAVSNPGKDPEGNDVLIPVENEAVQLTIPGDTVKVKDVMYQGELTWILINSPETVS